MMIVLSLVVSLFMWLFLKWISINGKCFGSVKVSSVLFVVFCVVVVFVG